MDASQTSDLLITYVKKSNLNFSLNESPFAFSISIKKTFIKDKDGKPRNSQLAEFEQQHPWIQDQNKYLQAVAGDLESDQEAFKHTISDLGMKLQKSKTEIADLMAEVNCAVKAKEFTESQLVIKNHDFNELNAEFLKVKNEKKELVKNVDTVQKEVIALRKQLEAKSNQLKEGLDNVAIRMASQRKSFEENLKDLKDFKAQKILEEKRQRKAVKKKSRKEKKKLLKSVFKNNNLHAAFETVVGDLFENVTIDNSLVDYNNVECTICAESIKDYVPKYFSGIPFNPACEKCDVEVESDENANMENDQDTRIPQTETSQNASTTRDSTCPDSTTRDSTCLASNSTNLDSTPRDSTFLNTTSTDQAIRGKLWKCEFCNQTYNSQNTFDQVYHTRGHQKEV